MNIPIEVEALGYAENIYPENISHIMNKYCDNTYNWSIRAQGGLARVHTVFVTIEGVYHLVHTALAPTRFLRYIEVNGMLEFKIYRTHRDFERDRTRSCAMWKNADIVTANF